MIVGGRVRYRRRSCRTLNGIGQRQYESPILKSAVRPEDVIYIPGYYNSSPFRLASGVEPIFFIPGMVQLSMKRKERGKREEKNTRTPLPVVKSCSLVDVVAVCLWPTCKTTRSTSYDWPITCARIFVLNLQGTRPGTQLVG
jgi:hypothetical protein